MVPTINNGRMMPKILIRLMPNGVKNFSAIEAGSCWYITDSFGVVIPIIERQKNNAKNHIDPLNIKPNLQMGYPLNPIINCVNPPINNGNMIPAINAPGINHNTDF